MPSLRDVIAPDPELLTKSNNVPGKFNESQIKPPEIEELIYGNSYLLTDGNTQRQPLGLIQTPYQLAILPDALELCAIGEGVSADSVLPTIANAALIAIAIGEQAGG